MSEIEAAIQKLVLREDLRRDEAYGVLSQIAEGTATRAQIAAFLVALRMKGETVDELAGAADAVRESVARVLSPVPGLIDTCGTGGDGQNTFNISTASALVVAAAGVPVAKHGNRSVSSRCGSADVLAELGVDVEAPLERVTRCIAEVGIGFLFAPRYHPAFRATAEIRRELGVRTLFNLLGPLANPAGVRRQVMGVFAAEWVPVVGRVMAALGMEHALVVHGDGLDELTVTGTTRVCEARGDEVRDYELAPEDVGLRRHPRAALAGGDPATNARILREVLEGAPGAPRDAVLMNAAAGLLVGGRAATLDEAVPLAAAAIDDGRAAKTLSRLVRESRGDEGP